MIEPSIAAPTPLPPCGGARAPLRRAEGGNAPSLNEPRTSLPILPHKEGGGASGKHPSRPRDYYRIEDEDGHRYWVFREGLYQESGLGSPGWFLHGVFG